MLGGRLVGWLELINAPAFFEQCVAQPFRMLALTVPGFPANGVTVFDDTGRRGANGGGGAGDFVQRNVPELHQGRDAGDHSGSLTSAEQSIGRDVHGTVEHNKRAERKQAARAAANGEGRGQARSSSSSSLHDGAHTA